LDYDHHQSMATASVIVAHVRGAQSDGTDT
jgi:hypothetical protein